MQAVGIAAGGAAASGLANVYGYNRESWLSNVGIKNSHRLQRQTLAMNHIAMLREDVRDLVQAAMQKQSSQVVITTLILGMVTSCFMSAQMPAEVPSFVVDLYSLCLGSSILYLVLALTCSVGSTIMASACQKEMLTMVLRLPIEHFEGQLNSGLDLEGAEAFERQRWGKVLRVPFLSERGDDASSREPPTSSARDRSQSNSSRSEGGTRCPSEAASAGSDRAERASLYTTISGGVPASKEEHYQQYREQEVQWEALTTYACILAAMGIGSFMQAYNYCAAARHYSDGLHNSWVFSSVFTFLQIMLTVAFNASFMVTGSGLSIAVEIASLIVAAGSSKICLTLASSEVREMALPLCFLAHLTVNCVGFYRLFRITPCSLRADEGLNASSDLEMSPQSQSHLGGLADHMESGFTGSARAASRLALAGALFVILLWSACLSCMAAAPYTA